MVKDNAPTDIRQVWSNIRSNLTHEIADENIERWIKPLLPKYVTNDKICLAAPDEFHREWIFDRFEEQIRSAAGEVLGYDVTVEIYVTGQLLLPNITSRQAIIPNSLARSSLFGVQARGQSEYLEQVDLESWKNVHMRYTGPQLDQHDLDVWLQCLRLMRHDELGTPIEFSAYGFLKEMGKGTSKRDYQNLDRRLTRLRAMALDIQVGNEAYVGGLLDRYYRHEGSGRFIIIADPLTASLFKNDQYARLNWGQRIQLRGQLAKFLHAYLPTHSTKNSPHFISVKKILKISRSRTKRLSDFRRLLRKACTELQDIGALERWWINDNDVIHFVRNYQLEK